MKSYKYIIFDFDGTINNTAPGIVATFKKVLEMYNVDYSGVDFNKHIGPPLEYSFKELVGGGRWQEALNTYRRVFVETDAISNSFLYDGIVDTLKKLNEHGYILSVATSKYEPFAIQSLKMLGISQYFTCLYGQTEKRGFKDEILAQLISDNGWEKSCCLMIGDTCYDVNGAKANGIDVMAVTYGFESEEKLKQANPDYITDSTRGICDLLLGDKDEEK